MRFQVIDVPNQRSMHKMPVPRGGGLSFVILTAVCFAVLAWTNVLPGRMCLALSIPPLAVGFIGLFDDFSHTSRRLRLAVQLFSATIGIWLIGGLPTLLLPTFTWQPSLLWLPLAAISLVWLTNLYNFMDGINGIAALEAITVLGGAAYLTSNQSSSEWSFALLIIAAIVAGFVPWNFPRAKIFMGDCGSGFLGCLIGLLVIATTVEQLLSLWSWMILLGVFLVDATWTLLRRMSSGQAWNEPHRSHAYQIISQKINHHAYVTLGIMAINLVWLLPLAKLAQYSSFGLYWVILAYTPLVLICVWTKAGSLEIKNINAELKETARQVNQ